MASFTFKILRHASVSMSTDIDYKQTLPEVAIKSSDPTSVPFFS